MRTRKGPVRRLQELSNDVEREAAGASCGASLEKRRCSHLVPGRREACQSSSSSHQRHVGRGSNPLDVGLEIPIVNRSTKKCILSLSFPF